MGPTTESPKIQNHQILLEVGFGRMEEEIYGRKPSYRQHQSLRRALAHAVSIVSRKQPLILSENLTGTFEFELDL